MVTAGLVAARKKLQKTVTKSGLVLPLEGFCCCAMFTPYPSRLLRPSLEGIAMTVEEL
ncbi:MAG: hypothetical protein HWN79_18960 [Candidatus Lokiarchaeota archaeon]|nr:hypothetical protein [Candidatus Lokiarchaeota archaeon]